MHKDYKSFNILNSYSESFLSKLKVDNSLEPITMPFTKKDESAHSDETVWNFTDLVFYNTKLFSPSANYFRDNGLYTQLHPLYNAAEYKKFWDLEESRRKNGYIAPCIVWEKEDGSVVLRNLHITGEHFGYLNYAEIKRVKPESLEKINQAVIEGIEIVIEEAEKVTDFPSFFDSDFYYFKALELARKTAKHIVVGKARRKGFSYKNGWITADSADLYPRSVNMLAAYSSDSLYPDGTMTMADNYLQRISKYTDWSKRRLIDKDKFIKLGYKRNDGLGIERGFLSVVSAVSFGPNKPGAVRGKDARIILWEESGKNRLLRASLDSALPTMKAGMFMTGLGIVFGTGGGDEVEWEGFEDLFYNPAADDFLAFCNIWDEDVPDTDCGFFVPSFMGKEGFIDRHGNSNVVGAINYEERIRDRKRKSNDPNKLNAYVMEEPFSPSEAFSRSGYNIFDTAQVAEQLRRVQRDPDVRAMTRTGYFVTTPKGIQFKDKLFLSEKELEQYHPPIINYPIRKNDDPFGCMVFWSQPYRDPATGKIPDNLYRIWHDPFALPKSKELVDSRTSLGVFYVYERYNAFTAGKGGRVIGSFIGRPETTEAFNAILFQCSDYCNANILFENDRGDVYNYAKTHGYLHRLVDEPNVFIKKETTTSVAPNKGISMNDEGKKRDGVVYLRDWHMAKRGVNQYGQPLFNINAFYCDRGLKEMLKFNLKGNFDAISTLIIGQFDIKGLFYTEIEKPVANTENNSIFDRDWF